MRKHAASLLIALLALCGFAVAQVSGQPPQASSAQQQNSSAQSNKLGGNNPAQQNGASSSANTGAVQNRNTPTANDLTVRGCLMRGKYGYTLMQSSTDSLFALEGDAGQFSANTGKLVDVRGRELEPIASSGMMPRFQAAAIRPVADQCPIKPGAESSGANATAGTTRNPEPDATPRYEPNNPNQPKPPIPTNPNSVQGTQGAPSAGTGNPPPAKPPKH